MNHYVPLALSILVLSTATSLARPMTATGDTPEARRATAALNILEARGLAANLQDKSFTAFSDFRQQGKDFVATVSEKGHAFAMVVDPDTGQVTPRE